MHNIYNGHLQWAFTMNYKNEIIDTQYSGGGAHHQNNVNVNANANANSNDNINNNHNHNATTVPSSPRQGKRKNKVIVATLSGKEKPLNPYTSLSPSPHGQIVLIGNKETIKFVSIEPSGLKEEKTVQISQVCDNFFIVALALVLVPSLSQSMYPSLYDYKFICLLLVFYSNSIIWIKQE